MTKYISLEKKPQNKTRFSHYLTTDRGWAHTVNSVKYFDKVVYLGKCIVNGDMFACYKNGEIYIYKGIKGDEF